MRYSFNKFILDTDTFELHHNSQRQAIEPQAISLLVLLIENRDKMVSKEEIYNSIWKGRIVSEAALSSRIKMIRQVLGDDGRSQHTIRTIHGKGFRFIANIETDQGSNTLAPALKPSLQENKKSAQQQSKPAVTVLPFLNLSNDSEQEYFADGVTTDIITHLSRHRWLKVTARNTAFCYKGSPVDICQLGKELNVSYVVEGSVQRSDQKIRINATLVDTSSGHQVWGEQYKRDITDLFSLQDEITETIAARLEPEIGFIEREKVVQFRPTNLQSWDCFHLGIFHFFKFTDKDNLEAQRLLLLSRELDPKCGDAFSWWAYAVILGMVYWSTKPSKALLNEALVACDTALSFDRQNATFYALKARALLACREYDRAIVENQRAIELNPTFAAAHCGLGDSLAYEGRYDESMICFEKAIALSPNDPQLWAFYSYGALALIFKGDYKDAVEWADKASGMPNCQYWAYAHKMVALAHLGEQKASILEKEKLLELCPEFSQKFVNEKLFYLKREEQIQRYIDGLIKTGF